MISAEWKKHAIIRLQWLWFYNDRVLITKMTKFSTVTYLQIFKTDLSSRIPWTHSYYFQVRTWSGWNSILAITKSRFISCNQNYVNECSLTNYCRSLHVLVYILQLLIKRISAFQACENGKWGENCQVLCHCSDAQEACDRFNGDCQSGCHVDYGGVGCNLGKIPFKSLTGMPFQEDCETSFLYNIGMI